MCVFKTDTKRLLQRGCVLFVRKRFKIKKVLCSRKNSKIKYEVFPYKVFREEAPFIHFVIIHAE